MVSTFQTNLNEIKTQIKDIGNGLLKANEILLQALEDCDGEKFANARAQIKNVGSKVNDIDNNIIKVLALYTPEARDLREVIAYLKITNDIARASSNTRSFIRGFTDVCKDVDVSTINEYALPMQASTIKAIYLTICMIDIEDEDEIQEIYNDVLIEESKTDDLYEMIERKLTALAEGSNDFEKFHKMLRALRKSEKIAARTISIANLLVYAKIGGSFRS